MREFCGKFMGSPGDRLFACGLGHGTCVDAYGQFQLCLPLRHPDTVYDLRAGSLKDALTSFFPQLRKARVENPDYLTRCARCFLKGLCEQCPAKSWMEHGTLDTPVEYLCAMAHAQARYLGLLAEGENAWEVRRETWRARIKQFTNGRVET
jgi:radical SAM protein with 4Fe4S-binding SPASM domain